MYDDIARDVQACRIVSKHAQDPVRVLAHPAHWRCVGIGTSAAVFQPQDHPLLAVKVYAPPFVHEAEEEGGIYEQLGDTAYFPTYYGRGDNYLLLAYRPGKNVYDCLVAGEHIPEQVLHDVEAAIAYARERGLNPSDLHVKNIMVYEGRGYVVDPSKYRRTKDCKRWDALKSAYYDYYLDLYRPGRTCPAWILETIRKWYKTEGESKGDGHLRAFAEGIKRLFF